MNIYNYQETVSDINYQFKVDRLDKSPNGVVIFMPSAKSLSAKNLKPYYPRIKWSSSLADYCVIYVADPFDGCSYVDEFNGSWFLSPTGFSSLPIIAHLIKNIIPLDTKNIFVYGSSMGGFGALYLGSLIGAKGVIAECPQIDLRKYPNSKSVLSFCEQKGFINEEWKNIFSFYRTNGFSNCKVIISLNIGDRAHIRYLTEELKDDDNRNLLSKLSDENILIKIKPHSSGFGHVNMHLDEGLNQLTELMKNN